MPKVRTDEQLQRAAEALVTEVRRLLDHDTALVKALGKSLRPAEARSRVRQLDALCEALEIELWRTGTAPDRTIVGNVAVTLKRGAAGIGLLVAGTAIPLVTTEVYETLRGVEAGADRVIECVVKDDADLDVIDAGDGAVPPSQIIDASADVHRPEVVTGQGSSEIGLEATAKGAAFSPTIESTGLTDDDGSLADFRVRADDEEAGW